MKRLVPHCLIFLIWFTAHAATNLPTGLDLRLGEKAVIELTAGLEQYDNPPNVTGKLTSAGSGLTMILVNHWASEFARLYPGASMEIHGGGSTNSLPDFLDGKLDLLPMSRPISADEAARFKQKFGYEASQIVVAQGAVGVYVNRNNPVTGFTLAQLDAIYSREAKRGGGRPEFWGDLGVTGLLADERIDRFCLSRAQDTHWLFRDLVMQGADYRFDVGFEAVSSSLVQGVGAEDAAVGFASVMFASARTRFVPLQTSDGRYLLPSYENITSGQYPLTRLHRIVFNRKPDGSMNPVAREFLRFAVSRRGQRIIGLADSYPITLEQQHDALRTIGAGH